MLKRKATGIEAVEKGSSFTTHHALTMGEEGMKTMVWLIVFSVFYLLSADTFSQESKDIHKPHQHRHQKYAKIKNPWAMTEQSIAEGKKHYEQHCVACHGEAGKGGIGPGLTGPVRAHGASDGEIFHAITDGIKGTAMRGFQKELTEDMRWHLVNYIKSLGKTEGKQ